MTQTSSHAKLKKNKFAGGMTQTVECLPNKHEALSSNPNTTKIRINLFSVKYTV
jgi:hypothetical protein